MNNDTTKSLRDSNIELLRIVSMFMIILFHSGFNITDEGGTSKILISMSQLIMASATNTFIFISGYYGVKFKLKTLFSLLIQGITLGVSLYLLSCFVFDSDAFSLNKLSRYFFPVSNHIWWFFSAYTLLFIMSPLLNKGMESLNKTQAIIVVLLIVYFNSNTVLLGYNIFSFSGNSLFQCISVYLLARLCKKVDLNIKSAIYLYPLGFILVLALMFYSYQTGHLGMLVRLASHNNPFSIINAVLLFYCFKNIKIRYNSTINNFATLTFGVYLVHEFSAIRQMRLDFIEKVNSMVSNPFIIILFLLTLSIVVYITSSLVEKIRQIVCNPIVNWIDKKYLDKIETKNIP